MSLPAKTPKITPQEYLRSEATATVKHEFHAGAVLAMSGGTYRHSRIAANLIGEIRARLKGSPCFVLESNMRVRIAGENRYVYPDATIVCGPPQFDPLDANQTTIVNPRVVIEVMSESTEAYDRGAKFNAYRELPSVVEYVLVSQDRPQIETFVRRDDGMWLFSTCSGLGVGGSLRSLSIELPLGEVFAGLEFPPTVNVAATSERS